MASKRVHAAIAGVFRAFHVDMNARIDRFNQHEDSVVVWIVGMSAGSLALLASQGKETRLTGGVRVAAILFAATILFGLGSRLLARQMQLWETRRWQSIIGSLSSMELESELAAALPDGLGDKWPEDLENSVNQLHAVLRGPGDSAARDKEEQQYQQRATKFARASNLAFVACVIFFVGAGATVVVAFFW